MNKDIIGFTVRTSLNVLSATLLFMCLRDEYELCKKYVSVQTEKLENNH